jgi:predicted RND superfamily exporter protein
LIGIIPNISPALAVGGIMGYFNIPLDMIMSTLMPMLLGLAVDDTIHFINHGKYEFQKTKNYNCAVKNTFRTVGKSLLMTSVVMIVNFSAYTTSIAKLYVNFGILASAGIFAALISDLFVTPVCLKLTHAFGRESVNETTENVEVLCQ